jgi:trehalose synthase
MHGFRDVLDPAEHDKLTGALGRLRAALSGRRIWHVNSTASGGGVAELLAGLLPYAAGAGVDVHWVTVTGDDRFFEITKRLHNRLHDSEGDDGPLDVAERRLYDLTLGAESDQLLSHVRPRDVVVLHDPQTAGLAPQLKRRGIAVVWRCHIGVDAPGPLARTAWDFLRGDVEAANACVFSRSAYTWDGLARDHVVIMAPCIDVLSSKNHRLDTRAAGAILRAAGLVTGNDPGPQPPRSQETAAAPRIVRRRAAVVEDTPVPGDAPLVAQVSRWDRLKDPAGVIGAFHAHAGGGAGDRRSHLVVAGPAVDGVDDDPESTHVFEEVRETRERLSADVRERVHLARLPMDDIDENGVIVNALQRRADIVVQKSRAEGFGLTVAEAMWKDRPVVASRVGGIQDQIVDGESGILVDDPDDLEAFGNAITDVLADAERARQMGKAARQRVCDNFLPAHHFDNEAVLLEQVLG